ncbi:hypothetical protein [Pelagicoccus albus]|uniref:Uncharacterized protein n=1 Tax=Pelagicoccus albus TaxID=415222 RepID=A0A7X1B8P3_9BACT|nr:hypothetical protein [Pelagicoccus albus]MBC2607752.1 hypothetical protein [Pelagicoccus albus]
MKKKLAGRSLLFSVAALALSACSDQRQEPAPETAVVDEVRTEKEAKERFLSGINWETHPEARATLYRDLLNKNDAVGELNSDSVHHSMQYEWFTLIDYEPGAYFRHPVAYAFLSYLEPELSMTSARHLPTVNYQPAWPNVAALLADEHIFYAESWLDTATTRSPESIVKYQASDWPPRMMADQCKNERRAYAVLIHNLEDLESSPETVANLEMMSEALRANGYSVHQFVQDPATGEQVDFLNLASPRGAGIRRLMNIVNIHVDLNDCCEQLIVYITGETTLSKTGYREEVALDLPFPYEGTDRSRDAEKKFYPEDLATFLSNLRTCHLNIIVDTNNAACFADDLLKIPNTESVLTACEENEYTYSSAVEKLSDTFQDPFGLDQGEQGSEFTSSVAKALFVSAASHKDGDAPPSAALLLKDAFESVKLYDLGFLGNTTNPQLQGRTMDSDCPCGIDLKEDKF